MADKLFAKHIIIEGRVQGVFFRKNTKQKAQELNITGWVKNANNDKVEILAFGNTEDLSKFITWCKQGPPKAIVKNIHVEETEIKHAPKEFSIVYED
jgi:acylphosphatase